MDLRIFSQLNFLSALKTLFKELKVPMNYVADEPTTAKEILKDTYKESDSFLLMDDVYFVGMVDDAAFKVSQASSLEINDKKKFIDYEGILIFGVTLKARPNGLLPTRSQLAEISRAFTREFYYTPVVVIFKYGNRMAFANTERLKYKQEWREGEKAGKVSLLRDISIHQPHSGHERILAELQIPVTGAKKVDSFAKLYTYWQEVFSVSLLNKKFYQELSNWYFWATPRVTFPGQPTRADAHRKNTRLEDLLQEHRATNVIRLLTRLLFVWFIKEKKLIPEELFELDDLQKDILNEISPYHETGMFRERNKESIYYKAILQNLFFATLNCPIESDSLDKRKRGFRGEGYGTHRGIDYLMRYKQYFKNPDAFLEKLNKTVPFLNGGLFECMDDKFNNLYIDGFSDQMTKGEQLIVPDYLFFGLEEETDLSDIVGIKDKKHKQAAVKGLINILKSYKFTITENTPIEEDVALDPELLGKVFENLLASYNPETKTTARKQTGSFYTPREIVNYMVDESLIAYLKNVPGASSFSSDLKVSEVSISSQSKDASGALEQSLDAFFDPNDEIQITQGNLPHWYQKGVFYFVTFRLADSIPKEKVEQLKKDREAWEKKYKNRKEYTKEEWIEYNRLFNHRVEEWMNAGYGSCLLKKKENAAIVAGSLKHFEGQRYILDEWVVMPNHVHVLVKPLGENKLSDILHSWKSYTANEINKREGKTGQLWMHESYDHIVRNERSMQAIRYYIRQNPSKAGIKVFEASIFEITSLQSTDAPDTQFTSLQSRDALDTMLHQLISFDSINPFREDGKITREIITALSTCTIVDPACGSGAFPMGILQKMVHILKKLDSDNRIWKEVQKQKAETQTLEAFDTLEDKQARETRLLEINEAFDQSMNDPDYARKLFLIENCIYGVDIQPIATQISKLRFFISLVTEQKVNPGKENFGIRPLPNLETRFVAANTLIGIKKDGGLFETDEIRALEKQLKAVRSKLFSARTKETKLKYRNRDKELRTTIAEQLQNQGLPLDSAEKLAAWDPYDQSASSPFFDPEWMFDIKDGFDVVIGNPPYGADIPAKQISLFKATYRLKTSESAILFIEKAYKILKTNGVLSYIIPKPFTYASNYRQTRDFVIKDLKYLVDCGESFENVKLEACVFGLTKNIESEHYNSLKLNADLLIEPISYINKDLKGKFGFLPNGLSFKEIELGLKVLNNSILLESVIKNSRGEILQKKIEFEGNIPVIGGKEINRYGIRRIKGHITDQSLITNKATINSNSLLAQNIVAHITMPYEHLKIIACIPNNTDCLIVDTINQLTILDSNISKQYLWSILNSKLINWYCYYFILAKAIRTIHFDNSITSRIPIKRITYNDQKSFIEVTDEIMAVKKNNSNTDTSVLEKQIDALVYKLYDLTDEETAVVEGKSS